MMSVTSEQQLYVGIHLPESSGAVPVALLKLQRINSVESGSFAYGLKYLERPDAFALNPDHLPLQRKVKTLAPTSLRDGGALPLTLRDALPDAWGRLVISRELGRVPDDIELLRLTNHDRVGSMVFSDSPTMPISESAAHYQLEDLAEAAARLEYDLDISPDMRRLLHQGGSLGGARPKASFVHEDALWLAKFSAKDDEVDVPILECATARLATLCSIRTPEVKLVKLNKGRFVLLSKRFDRVGSVTKAMRLHYLSASALLSIPYESSAGSYVALAQVIRRLSSHPKDDLIELFRRMVFNMVVDNSDDHIKNHGALFNGNGQMRLSPAFDVVPQLTNLGYQMLSADGSSHNSDLSLARKVASQSGLSKANADKIIQEIIDTISSNWREVFTDCDADARLLKRFDDCLRRQAILIGAST
jgi:serine/threonine-protein kinase HipA